MIKYYAVICKSVDEGKPCKTVFKFDVATALLRDQIEFPCPPLDGLTCPICHQTHAYSSDDVLELVLPDPLSKEISDRSSHTRPWVANK
jgi:hypothetical protein